ncbi:zinc finger MYM-type 3-like [Paramuricea clavata]|uniref:Zinc finger MYM-type 3-like n=1 Tax=Paramuricea clavata TaxID=317549 RepID=A0A7D9LEX7_PARCT|nr:zinc finger MYM-type 3-like [Paramuricea clavata]
MKATHREGESLAENRTRREKEAITDDEEGLLWSKGLLGDKTAQNLVYTIYFYIEKIFRLRACEHRQLRLSNFVIENNKICYRENISKTFHGGLKDLKKKPRIVTYYCHEDEESVHEPYLFQMFKQYISLVSELPKVNESFYFRPSKTAYKFENAPIEAGLEIKTAHCLRATTATNLFRAGHQEKLIRERTGHVSSALFTYEKPSNDQAMAVSKCVGPSVSKVVSLVDNYFKPPSKPKEDENFKFPTRNLISF